MKATIHKAITSPKLCNLFVDRLIELNVSSITTPSGLRSAGAVCLGLPVFTVAVPATTHHPSHIPSSQPTATTIHTHVTHEFFKTNFIGILSIVLLIGVLRFNTIFVILPIKKRKPSHLYDILVVISDGQEAILENIRHEDIFFFRKITQTKDAFTDNIWMMNVSIDPLERRFEVQFLDQYDLLGFGDIDCEKSSHKILGDKIYSKEVYLHKPCMQIGMVISVKLVGSTEPVMKRKVQRIRNSSLSADTQHGDSEAIRRAKVPPLHLESSEFYSLEAQAAPKVYTDFAPKYRARAPLGTLEYSNAMLRARGNVSPRSRSGKRNVRMGAEASGMSQWEEQYSARYSHSKDITAQHASAVAAAAAALIDSDQDSFESLSIDLRFSDDGSVTRSVDGSSSARGYTARRLVRSKTHRAISSESEDDGVDIIPPRSRKAPRVTPRRHTSISSCGSSVSTSSEPLSARGATRLPQSRSEHTLRIGDEVLQCLEWEGQRTEEGEEAERRAGEEKTREEAERRPWGNLIPWDVSRERKWNRVESKLPIEVPVSSTPAKGHYGRDLDNLNGPSGIRPQDTDNDIRNERSRSKSPSNVRSEAVTMEKSCTDEPLCTIVEEEEKDSDIVPYWC